MRTATSRAGREQRADGFTLLELLVVLTLIALIASLAMPRYHLLLPGMERRAAARLVADGLTEARGRAIREGREITVLFDLTRRRLKLPQEEAWRPLAGDDTRLTLEVARREHGEEGLAAVRFYPDGSSTGGRLEIAGEGERWILDVDWLTGRVALTEG